MARRSRRINSIKKTTEQETPFLIEESKRDETQVLKALERICEIYEFGGMKEALLYTNEILETHKTNLDALLLYAKLLWKNGEHEKAVYYIAKCYNLSLTSPKKDDIGREIRTFYSEATYLGKLDTVEEILLKEVKNTKYLEYDLSFFYTGSGEYLKAKERLEALIAKDETYIINYFNLSTCYLMLGDPEKALNILRLILKKQPDMADAQSNYAYVEMVSLGKFTLKGLEYYDNPKNFKRRYYKRCLPQPLWDGSNIKDKKLLISSEQGIGDEIRFFPHISQLQHLYGEVVFECSPKLVPIFARSVPDGVVVKPHPLKILLETTDKNRPDIDFHSPLGSLRRFAFIENGQRHIIPNNFLIVDPDKKTFWKNKIDELTPKNNLKVGICWVSGKINLLRKKVYPTDKEWNRLFEINGVTFFNANYAPQSQTQLDKWENETGVKINNFLELDQRDDLDSTAAYLSNMDLVISVGTAVDELAAGIGIKTWKITNHSRFKECRLRPHGFESPNIYRVDKQITQDWSEPFKVVRDELEQYAKTHIYPEIDIKDVT